MARVNRRSIYRLLVVAVLLALCGSHTPAAGDLPNEFAETFSTKLFCDTVFTTAHWDTVAGELKLHPFELVLAGSCSTPDMALGVAISGNYAFVVDFSLGLQVVNISNPAAPVLAGSYDTPGGANGVAVSGDYAYVADDSSGLQVIDISNPAAPVLAGSYDTPSLAYAVAVSGDCAYVADYSSGLQVIDVSNPAAPVLAGSYDTPGGANGVAVSGDYAYVADDSSGLQVIDISNPAAPVLAGNCNTPGRAVGVAVSGDYAYVADFSSGLQVINISNPAAPVLAGSYDTPGTALKVTVSGDYAYVADASSGLQVIDISNPAAPVPAGNCNTPGNANGVAVSGDYAYVADLSNGLQVIDISNPAAPVPAGDYTTPGINFVGVAVSGDYAYVADFLLGLQVIDIARSTTPMLRETYNTSGTAYHCSVSGNYAYVADYASGLQVVDITNPTLPNTAGSYNTAGSALGVAVDGDHAYVADGASGLQVIDISDPDAPSLAGGCNTPGEAYAAAVAGNYVYVADGDSGLKVVNVTNPAAPALAGGYDTPGYAYGIAVEGDYAFVAEGASGLQVVDITNPNSPSLLGSYNTTGEARAVCVDGDYLYVADGGSGVVVIDVSNPASPSLAGNYDTQGFAYGVTVAGDFAFVADGGSGFLVLDITDPATPALVGGLDTPGSAYGLTAEGDYVFLADGGSGLSVIEVFQRGFQGDKNRGQSLVFFETDKEISAVRFTPTQVDSIYWYASADSGVNWTYVPADTFWHQVNVPGHFLAWRAELFSAAYHVNPTCTEVGVEWKYNSALIDTVRDVPEDEGGWAYVRFQSSGLDVASQGPSVVKHYYVHRRIDDIGFTDELREKGERVDHATIAMDPGAGATQSDEPKQEHLSFPGTEVYILNGHYYFVSVLPVAGALPPGTWSVVAAVPALQENAYYSLTPTAADSMSVFEYTIYCITAHTDESTVYYVSPPDSGYSRDNLAPMPPADLRGDYAYPPSQLFISWDRNRERDLSHYAIYKGDNPDFVPSPTNRIGVPWDTAFVDTEFDPNTDNYYKISAWDIHENEGTFSLLTPEDISQVENPPPTPAASRLEQNAPNPFNPTTVIKYSVARQGWVTLRVYDMAGRRVRTLVESVKPSGWYDVVWDGRDDEGRGVPSGVYAYELQAPLHREARKMVVLR